MYRGICHFMSGLLFSSLLLSACATNPVTGHQDFVLMSESEEISLGNRYSREIAKQEPAYRDTALNAYINRVGQKLAAVSHRPGLQYHFQVVDSSDVNAFALPGGYIYITRGLLAYLNSEAELAAVLGHEIGHVTARHSVRQHSASTATSVLGAVVSATTGVRGTQDLFNIMGGALLSGYGREHELEADRLGAQYLARAGYDPQAMIKVIGVLKNQELFEQQLAKEEGRKPRVYHGLFATHPSNDRRLQEVVAEAGRLPVNHVQDDSRDAFLSHLDGLAFGDSEQDGVVKDNRFFHKALDFAIRVPAGWQIDNQPDRLVMTPPDQDAILELQVKPLKRGVSPHRFLESLGIRGIRNGRPLQIHSLQAYAATAPVRTSSGRRTARLVVIYDRDKAYLFTGVSKDRIEQRDYDEDFMSIANSYHRLSAQEKQLAAGQRLKIIPAPPGTTMRALARQSPLGKHAEDQLRLLNGLYPTGEPRAGQRIKIVR